MKFTPRGEFPRQRPLLASPLVLLSGEELIITEFPRQRPLLASPLVLLSGEQLGVWGRGRYLLPTPGVIFDACGWAWTFSSSPRAARSAHRAHPPSHPAPDQETPGPPPPPGTPTPVRGRIEKRGFPVSPPFLDSGESESGKRATPVFPGETMGYRGNRESDFLSDEQQVQWTRSILGREYFASALTGSMPVAPIQGPREGT